ncbi:MAG: YdcF family protein [Nitratireductor sp.]
MVDCANDNGDTTVAGSPPGKGALQRMAKRASQLLLIAMIMASAALLAGFVQFYRGISDQGIALVVPGPDAGTAAAVKHADGIVVLTGGSARIATALELLENGTGRRLLISGVHPSTSLNAIRAAVKGKSETFDCCIDIDRAALDTYGNAEETRKWAEQYGFRSLIVVTSDYHMPRSLVEMRRTMPRIEFIPHAVNYGPLKAEGWFSNPGTLRIVASEYLKYLAARLRKEMSGYNGGTAFANASGY